MTESKLAIPVAQSIYIKRQLIASTKITFSGDLDDAQSGLALDRLGDKLVLLFYRLEEERKRNVIHKLDSHG